MDADDIAYNSLQGELPDGEHHFFGDIDYAVVDCWVYHGQLWHFRHSWETEKRAKMW